MLEPDHLAALMSALDQPDAVYVAIRSSSGPHVTPELFTVSGDRILCLTAASTLKARAVRNGDVVGLCASWGDRCLALAGSIQVLDPLSPQSAFAAPAAAVQAPLGVARFVRDNAAEMVGAAVDALAGRLGRPLPPHRVMLAVTPTSAVLAEAGTVRWAVGWDGADELPPAPSPAGEPPEFDLGELPGALGELVVSGPAVVGWLRTGGAPMALPARWDADELVATLPLAVFNACGAARSGPASVTFDGWTGHGPSGKHGVMLRGAGTAARDGEMVRFAMQIGRVSYWDGIETGTVGVGAS